jgi:hypothetical protein
MISGVTVDSYSKTAAWTGTVGAWSTDYPAANLGDLLRPTKVARVVPASGLATVTAVLAGPMMVQMAALVHHTFDTAAGFRVRLYGDFAMTMLRADSGWMTVWPTGISPDPDFLAVRPHLFPEAVATRAVVIDFDNMAGSVDIGAIELARFWDWEGISPGAELGFDVRTPPLQFAGGAAQGVQQWMPRTYNGQLDLLDMKVAASRGIDFFKLKGTSSAFVFVDDYEDATSWARGCFLARNTDVPAMVGAIYRHDTFQFRLSEVRR